MGGEPLEPQPAPQPVSPVWFVLDRLRAGAAGEERPDPRFENPEPATPPVSDPEGELGAPGVSAKYPIVDGHVHQLLPDGPGRPLFWLLIQFVSTVSTDTANIGFGATPAFTLMANAPPIVLREINVRQSQLVYQSTAAVANGAYISVLGV